MALPATSRALSPFDGLIQTALTESTSLPLNVDTNESRDTIENDSIARRRRLVRRVLFVVRDVLCNVSTFPDPPEA
jgi:hypothetical protein